MKLNDKFNNFLKKQKLKGITNAFIASQIGIDRQALYAIRKGRYHPRDKTVVRKIKKVSGVQF